MYSFFKKIINNAKFIIWKIFFSWEFYAFGKKSKIYKPLKINGSRGIHIGDYVTIFELGWLLAIVPNNYNKKSLPLIHISNNVHIGHLCHIVSAKSIFIDSNVTIGDRVYISDNSHAYLNPFIPIISQGITVLPQVKIGEGSWIGDNACIVGASIGKNCVVAANSLVVNDVSDYSMVAGIPARVIKKYDINLGKWI